MHSAQSTQTVGDGKVRSRPYVGRYVPPPPPEPPAPLSVADRIKLLLTSVKHARYNAHYARREGNIGEASAAFFRAHEYVEMVRELRARL